MFHVKHFDLSWQLAELVAGSQCPVARKSQQLTTSNQQQGSKVHGFEGSVAGG